MRFSQLVERVNGEGADAWVTHSRAAAARARGEDVLLLSIGDPDLGTIPAVIDRAIERLRTGDIHYTPAAGRRCARRLPGCIMRAAARTYRPRTSSSSPAHRMHYLPPLCAWRAAAMR